MARIESLIEYAFLIAHAEARRVGLADELSNAVDALHETDEYTETDAQADVLSALRAGLDFDPEGGSTATFPAWEIGLKMRDAGVGRRAVKPIEEALAARGAYYRMRLVRRARRGRASA